MKLNELYKQLVKANQKMEEAMHFEDTEPLREATIQRFEYTFELSWKLMSAILKSEGLDVYGIRNVIREAFKLKLIDDVEKWLEYAKARNLSSHIYREEVALEVYRVAKSEFVDSVSDLLEVAKNYIST